MAGSSYESPSEYIGHHLSNNVFQLIEHDFMVVHLDSFVMAVLLGVLSIGLIWLVARKATFQVPTKTHTNQQAQSHHLQSTFDFLYSKNYLPY